MIVGLHYVIFLRKYCHTKTGLRHYTPNPKASIRAPAGSSGLIRNSTPTSCYSCVSLSSHSRTLGEITYYLKDIEGYLLIVLLIL